MIGTKSEQQSAKNSSPPWRFGFGEVTGPMGSVWRLWVGSRSASDVYVSTRNLGGSYKTSIHASGSCQTSVTSEKWSRPEVAMPTHLRFDQPSIRNSRHLAKWTAVEMLPGIAMALRIIVPALELDDLPYADQKARDVLWLPPPRTGEMAVVSVLIASFPVPTAEWPGCETGAQLIGKAILPNDKTLFCVYTYESSQTWDYPAGLPYGEIGVETLSRRANRVLGVGVSSDGVGFLREFSLFSFVELVPGDSALGKAIMQAHRNVVAHCAHADNAQE